MRISTLSLPFISLLLMPCHTLHGAQAAPTLSLSQALHLCGLCANKHQCERICPTDELVRAGVPENLITEHAAAGWSLWKKACALHQDEDSGGANTFEKDFDDFLEKNEACNQEKTKHYIPQINVYIRKPRDYCKDMVVSYASEAPRAFTWRLTQAFTRQTLGQALLPDLARMVAAFVGEVTPTPTVILQGVGAFPLGWCFDPVYLLTAWQSQIHTLYCTFFLGLDQNIPALDRLLADDPSLLEFLCEAQKGDIKRIRILVDNLSCLDPGKHARQLSRSGKSKKVLSSLAQACSGPTSQLAILQRFCWLARQEKLFLFPGSDKKPADQRDSSINVINDVLYHEKKVLTPDDLLTVREMKLIYKDQLKDAHIFDGAEEKGKNETEVKELVSTFAKLEARQLANFIRAEPSLV